MTFFSKLSTMLLLAALMLRVGAQEAQPVQPSLDNGTIESQFDYLITKSNRYQDYRVVKRTWLDKLKSHVADSLNLVRNDLTATQQVVSKQKQEIGKLKQDLQQRNEQLAAVDKEKNSIAFFGMQIEKSVYKTIMWAIVGLLLASLLFFIYKFKHSNTLTVDTKMTLIKIQEEYEAYKRKALEKQQQLKRELQDELNKQL